MRIKFLEWRFIYRKTKWFKKWIRWWKYKWYDSFIQNFIDEILKNYCNKNYKNYNDIDSNINISKKRISINNNNNIFERLYGDEDLKIGEEIEKTILE